MEDLNSDGSKRAIYLKKRDANSSFKEPAGCMELNKLMTHCVLLWEWVWKRDIMQYIYNQLRLNI